MYLLIICFDNEVVEGIIFIDKILNLRVWFFMKSKPEIIARASLEISIDEVIATLLFKICFELVIASFEHILTG